MTKWSRFSDFLGEVVHQYGYLLIYIAVVTTATLVWTILHSHS